MITIKRHPNLDNWLNISFFGKLIDQTTSRVEALAIAGKLSRKNKGAEVYDLDANPIHLRNGQLTKNSWGFKPFRIDCHSRSSYHLAKGLSILRTKTKRQNLIYRLRTRKLWQTKRNWARNLRIIMIDKILFAISVLYIGAFGLGILFGAAAFADMVTRGIWWSLYFLFLGCSYFGWCGKTSKIQIQIGKKDMKAKHFIAVANSINKVLKDGGDAEGLRTLAENLANEFEEFNPHFSRETFLLLALSPAWPLPLFLKKRASLSLKFSGGWFFSI